MASTSRNTPGNGFCCTGIVLVVWKLRRPSSAPDGHLIVASLYSRQLYSRHLDISVPSVSSVANLSPLCGYL
ncbi:MAG: hypothetical protein KatS3mg109_1586 [Pirellulaceae bacterium]|nr:MAG: hypothetical protein KatS3mg109_1586 [Pirellulaceae bacterium]